VRRCADAGVTVSDDAILETQQLLNDIEQLQAGEAAAAGAAALVGLTERDDLRAALKLDGASRVLLIGTEASPEDL
jgi:diaminopropionate ammonia-lyase